MGGWGVSGFCGYVECGGMGNEKNSGEEVEGERGGV